LDIWQKTLGVILSDPWKFFLGTGSGTQLYWTRFEAQGHYFSAHNAYLTIWLETGIFGLLSFIGLFYVLFSKSLKTITHNENKAYRSIIFAMLGIVPVWLIQCGFSSIFLDHASRAFILVLIALGANTLCAESNALESPEYSLNIQLANNPYR
jgi:O-antigen ligase